MNITMLNSKIHRATVTDANLNYEGSISICTKLMESTDLLENQKVDIVNINNGERFSTYVIPGTLGEICLNGAASRKVQKGDKVIIMSYVLMDSFDAKNNHSPKIVFVDNNNSIKTNERSVTFKVELFFRKDNVSEFTQFPIDLEKYKKATEVRSFTFPEKEDIKEIVLGFYPDTAYIHILDKEFID